VIRPVAWLGRALLLASVLPWAARADGLLDSYTLSDTNRLCYHGLPPVSSTNLVSVPGALGENALLLDTTNVTPAFLLYNTVETTNASLDCSNGTLSFWFNPDWTSADQSGGTGPGDWADFITLGDTNGSNFWGLYLDPGGTDISFAASADDGSLAIYLSGSLSLASGTWHYFVLTYGPTNSSLYFDGRLLTNGSGVTLWAATNVTFFALGSDTNGFHQARGVFSRLETYDYQLQSNVVLATFEVLSALFYGGPEADSIGSAPSTPTNNPTFNAISGPGYLQRLSAVSNCASTNVVIARPAATSTNMVFDILGPSSLPYDLFAAPSLPATGALTNATWSWMGQGYACNRYSLSISNRPLSTMFLVLGTPLDEDQDGLTTAYELLISHTDPHKPDTSGDGMLDGWKVLWGLNPLTNNVAQSGERSNFTYDPVGWLEILSGSRTESIGLDAEGNVKTSQ
jgi:hypothetical protein